MFPQLGGYVIDKRDPLYSVWGMAWQAHALATDPLGLFDTNIMYPFRGTLAFDELSFAEAVLAAPLYYLTGNPVLSHNALLFATFVLSGYGIWLLVRELAGGERAAGWAGFVAGTAFAFSFYRLNHLPHQTLINTQWMPFVLLASYRLLGTRSWLWAWALGAFFLLQALSGHYLAFYTAILLALFFPYYFLTRPGAFSWSIPAKLVVVMFTCVLAMLPIVLPYVQLQRGYNFERSLFEAERFSNTLASFLAVYRGNPAYQSLLAPFRDPGPWALERAAFPGIAVLALAVAGVVMSYRAASGARPAALRRHVLFYGSVALLSALLSLGPSLQPTYAPDNYDPNAIRRIMPLPYALLHQWVPGFDSMRVTARITVLLALALSVLAGIGACHVLGRLASTNPAGVKRWAWAFGLPTKVALPAAALMLAALPVLESWSVPVRMEPVGTRSAVPAVYRWLAQQPHTVILEYPMTHYRRGDESVEMANLYQYYSVYHWHYMVNGSTTIKPYAYSALVLETERCFPCPRSLGALRALGVEYVVVHLENLSGPQREEFLWRSTSPVARVLNYFHLVQDFGSDRVYRLTGPDDHTALKGLIPAGASVLLADPLNDPERRMDERVAGGYVAALGYYLRDYTLYGDPRLSLGQPIRSLEAGIRPDYALLWASQDPRTAGYLPQNRIWHNEHVALYRLGSGMAVETSGCDSAW
jgi:hypothetical protein